MSAAQLAGSGPVGPSRGRHAGGTSAGGGDGSATEAVAADFVAMRYTTTARSEANPT